MRIHQFCTVAQREWMRVYTNGLGHQPIFGRGLSAQIQLEQNERTKTTRHNHRLDMLVRLLSHSTFHLQMCKNRNLSDGEQSKPVGISLVHNFI